MADKKGIVLTIIGVVVAAIVGILAFEKGQQDASGR